MKTPVQLAKTELQSAADAAARYAVTGLSDGTYASKAAAVAAQNSSDGSPVVLVTTADNSDVVWGRWDTATNALVAGGSPADTVQVTARRTAARGNPVPLAWARVLGQGACDVTATATAVLAPQKFFGLIGLDSASISGGGNTDSFDSRLGTYASQTPGHLGSIGSNGDITVGGSGVLDGDARPGPGHAVSVTGQGTVTGVRNPLTSTMSFAPAAVPATAAPQGAVSLSSGTYSVAAGDYYCTSVSISNSATFKCTGPVRLYCTGPFTMSGGYITTYQNRPSNFQVYMVGSGTVTLNGQADFYAQIYAPQSAFFQSGRADIYGSVVARTLSFGGTWAGGVHYDVSLNTSATTGATISLVK